jgi:hypothetical protein
MAKTKQRIDWRSLARRIINDEDLHYPDVQPDHPVMKELREIVYLNGLDDYEREAVRRSFESTGVALPMETCYKIAKGGKPDMAELVEMLFTGLLDDVSYEDFVEMRERDPDIDARTYYEKVCAFNEPDPAVKKLARIFSAILDEPETLEEYIPYISRQEFEKMRHDPDWVQKNLKSLEKSKKVWPGKLGR